MYGHIRIAKALGLTLIITRAWGIINLNLVFYNHATGCANNLVRPYLSLRGFTMLFFNNFHNDMHALAAAAGLSLAERQWHQYHAAAIF